MTDCDVKSDSYGGILKVFKGVPHKAACGMPCSAGSDVSIGMVMSGLAHSGNKCPVCYKDGRGYPRPGEAP